jgi:hypothetical protein
MPLELKLLMWLPATGKDVLDLAGGHQFGLLECTPDRLHGGFDVDDDAFAQPLRLGLPQSDDLEAAVGQHFGDGNHDLRGADIEPDDQILGFVSHCCCSFSGISPAARRQGRLGSAHRCVRAARRNGQQPSDRQRSAVPAGR